ncbi:tetratricopeptide repeat protein [Roseicyclus persicicus]|uniref:Tetratricopeptide repeat protein n=1 Tax=Roseicyclus persicicus TaxID=2650661 RepID=A0A7X6GVA1_9RHOB|nr:tetratricopeptide repeat protein [Roseibacterium persicicum]NKX43041.1 tetratricopeptide repeat protein [Roseibacterium persicicum]
MRRRILPVLPLALGLALAQPVGAQVEGPGLAGAYLAARTAVIEGNHRAAAIYFENALAADPGNPMLIGNAIFANAALGQWGRASTIAEMLPEGGDGQDLVNLVRMVQGLAAGDLVGARAAIEAGQGAGQLIDELAMGWIHLGEGDMRRATETFEAAAQGPLADIAYTHLALARAAVGDFEGADAIFSGAEVGPLPGSERSVRARAEVLVQLDRRDAALELLDLYTASVPDPALLALRADIATRDGTPAYDFITTPTEGLAEVFYMIARGLGGEGGSTTLPLLYTRAAHGIDPGHSEALLYAGQLLMDADQYSLAADAFSEVPPGDAQYVEAQLGRADAYFEDGREEAAVTVLRSLAEAHPDLATVQAAFGDALRRTEQCTDAVAAYTAALDLVDITQQRYWFLYYTRGICHEVLQDFAASEADFRQALVLNPEQPQVLNNLGYSLVEQRRNLDEALGMIERAVEARPDSGYIVDSLGWVLYRLGRFDEAVEPMERAVALLPNDPIINDHLGDVYWMVGRHREARFQWERALSFEPEEADAARIRRKLEIGLDRVLEEEGGVGETQ